MALVIIYAFRKCWPDVGEKYIKLICYGLLISNFYVYRSRFIFIGGIVACLHIYDKMTRELCLFSVFIENIRNDTPCFTTIAAKFGEFDFKM